LAVYRLHPKCECTTKNQQTFEKCSSMKDRNKTREEEEREVAETIQKAILFPEK
jgi:hypothetical protein